MTTTMPTTVTAPARPRRRPRSRGDDPLDRPVRPHRRCRGDRHLVYAGPRHRRDAATPPARRHPARPWTGLYLWKPAWFRRRSDRPARDVLREVRSFVTITSESLTPVTSRAESFDVIVVGSGIGGIGFAAWLLARPAPGPGARASRQARRLHPRVHEVGHHVRRRSALRRPHGTRHHRPCVDGTPHGGGRGGLDPDARPLRRRPSADGTVVGRPSSRDGWRRELIERFPPERRGFERLTRDLERTAGWYGATSGRGPPPPSCVRRFRLWGARRHRLASPRRPRQCPVGSPTRTCGPSSRPRG